MFEVSKLKLAMELLSSKQQELLNPTTFEVHSVDFSNIGIDSISVQEEILKYLSNDKKYIRYTARLNYSSREDIEPTTLRDLHEVASMSLQSVEQLIDEVLQWKVYTITTLEDLKDRQPDEKYRLTYSKTRELRMNGILIAKPDSFTENDNFLTYIFSDGGKSKRVSITELTKSMGVEKLTKTPHQILGGLHIDTEMRAMFFPGVSKKGFDFINPVTNQYVRENNLPELNLEDINNNRI